MFNIIARFIVSSELRQQQHAKAATRGRGSGESDVTNIRRRVSSRDLVRRRHRRRWVASSPRIHRVDDGVEQMRLPPAVRRRQIARSRCRGEETGNGRRFARRREDRRPRIRVSRSVGPSAAADVVAAAMIVRKKKIVITLSHALAVCGTSII